MERGSELLIVLFVLLLAALDLLARWLRGKTQLDQPAGAAGGEEEVVSAEEADTELPERAPAAPRLPPAAPPPPLRPPRPAPPTTARPRRPHRARRWVKDPIDARRGIILMTILGPCRGLEAPGAAGEDSAARL